jgi:hypothetical protein
VTDTSGHDNPLDEFDADLGERFYRNSQDEEDRLTEEMIAIIARFIDRRFNDYEGRRLALRDAHAKNIGCVHARFRVDSELAPALRQGVFIPGREYDAWIRFSNGNSEINGSRYPDARGMAMKLMGVDGAKFLSDEKSTQDFIMADNPVFFVDDLRRYADTLEEFHSGGRLMQFISARHLQGRERRLAFLNSFHWITNPLFRQYWSMTAYRLGAEPGKKMAIKFTAKPRLPPGEKAFKWRTFLSPGFSLGQEVSKTLAKGEARFDFYVQRFVDDRRTPVEDTGTHWEESVARPEHVAEIVIPAQDLLSAERYRFCENLSFNPWHSLPEHKPLGAVNRARKRIYVEMSKHRHRLNQVPMTEPSVPERGRI